MRLVESAWMREMTMDLAYDWARHASGLEGGGIMTKQHLIWLITLAGMGLLALVFIFSDQLPRVPFVFT